MVAGNGKRRKMEDIGLFSMSLNALDEFKRVKNVGMCPKIAKFGYGMTQLPNLVRQRENGICPSFIESEIQGHGSLIRKLSCESVLDKHTGCVNTLSWNANGTLLASGSDDTDIVVWDYYTKKARHVIKTGHTANIFGVCFVPGTSDQVIASGAMDCQVQVHYAPFNVHKEFNLHEGRVKDVKSSPLVPHVFWTVGEDSVIGQFDLRTLPSLNCRNGTNVLIRLGDNEHSKTPIRGMAMDVHPLDANVMAVACGDNYIRTFDRRKLDSTNGFSTPVTAFSPRHLHESIREPNQHGTSVQFNSTGSEVLVSFHNDHIYLYNATSVDKNYGDVLPKMSYNHAYRQRTVEIDLAELRELGIAFVKNNMHNRAIDHFTFVIEIASAQATRDVAELVMAHFERASMLFKRKWRGDVYLALEDVETCLELDPYHRNAMMLMINVFQHLGDKEKMVATARKYQEHFPLHKGDVAKYLNPGSPECAASRRSMEANAINSDSEGSSSVNDYDSDKVFDTRYHRNRKSFHGFLNTRPIRRFIGYCNIQTDIKEARFFGGHDTHIVAGSDDGHALIWEKDSGKLVNALKADNDIVNCVQVHPFDACLATSGIENVIRLWSPTESLGESPAEDFLEELVHVNQNQMSQDLFHAIHPIDQTVMRLFLQQYENQTDAPIRCAQS